MRKKGYLIATSLALISIITSCGSAIDPTADWTIDVNKNKSNITLNTYFPNSTKSNDFFQNSYIPKQLEKITGYKVKYNQTSEGAADTQVQAMLTGKEKIDMLKISPTLFNNYVTQGYFTDLTDGIDKYCPNLKTCAKITQEQWDAVTYNGKIYALPEIGHTSMVNVGLIWNFDHLKSVNINKLPKTITEVDEALKALQTKYGSDTNYHALGLPGTMSEANPFTAAFDVPCNFFVNDNNEIQNMLFSDRMEEYLKYMNTLATGNIIAQGWSSQTESACMNNFVSGFSSCMVISYWNVTNLRSSLISSYKGFPSDVITENSKKEYVYGKNDHQYGFASDDALVQWEVFIKGDGKLGTNVQTEGKSRDSRGVGYYITVPVASSKNAAYTLDWINYKLTEEATILNVAGTEGIHYEKTTKDDKDAVKLLTGNSSEEYVKVLPKFYDEISGTSQYQTTVNGDVARKWWPVAEVGFDAWEVLMTDESRVILDPFALHPVLTEFSKVDLLARNYVVTQLQNIINKGIDKLENARKTYNSRYWKAAVKNEVNNWYKNK